MTAIQDIATGYTRATQAVRTPRGIEYDAFARATQSMKAAHDRGKSGFADLADAILTNRRLWTLLAIDVSDSKNALPRDLRARIMYLSEFTREHSRRVMQEAASPAPLIEINRAIMTGLRETAAANRRSGA